MIYSQEFSVLTMSIPGAHVSAAGGIFTCFSNAEKIGAKCIQIFGSSPRGWTVRMPQKADVKTYKKEERGSGIGPVFLHAAYLVNLATPNPALFKKSVESLVEHLTIAKVVGAQGLIFHLGSFKGSTRERGRLGLVKGIQETLKRVPGSTTLIMENSSGGGDKIGSTIEEIGWIFRRVKHKRLAVCFDTQHAFAAGIVGQYSEDDVARLASSIEKSFGLKNLICVHANDSKSDQGSFVDRHENIGEGKIGMKGLSTLAQHPHFQCLPWILEVPGFEGKGSDKKNIVRLKRVLGW